MDPVNWINSRTIYLTKHGSHAYGTNLPTSDLDVKGIAVAPREYLLGAFNRFEQYQRHAEDGRDLEIFDLRKFCTLAADANPNMLEVLFVDERDWLEHHPLFLRLYAIRRAFVSKAERIAVQDRIEATIAEIAAAWMSGDCDPMILAAGRQLGMSDNLIEAVDREKRYATAANQWQQYQQWLATRNPARMEVERRFGFDTKHALHLVRLMRMCREILETGEVLVRRPDAEELLAIRAGAWTYEQVVEWAKKQDRELDELHRTSTLPRSADRIAIDAVVIEITERALAGEL